MFNTYYLEHLTSLYHALYRFKALRRASVKDNEIMGFAVALKTFGTWDAMFSMGVVVIEYQIINNYNYFNFQS